MILRIKPGILVRAAKDHGHPVVNLAHERIGFRRHNRKRSAFVRSARSPRGPNPRNTHNGFILKVDFERALALAIPLPFVKTAQRDDASLADYQISIESALENRFASGVDR